MTADGEEWSIRFTDTGKADFLALEADDQDQLQNKLTDIVESPWRDPPDYGEPLQNSPYKKVRIGQFRLSVTFDRTDNEMVIARIKHRSGAYTADD